MAKIFVSMSGEGRGHATRIKAVVDSLSPRHCVHILAPGDAHALLAPAYAGTAVTVREIPGLRFSYNGAGRLDFLGTGATASRYLAGFPRLISTVEEQFRAECPDLVITDFEPSLPRAARRCGIPFISLNHQHFLVVNDLSSLPPHLRRHAAFMGMIVRAYYSGMARTIVSSFYFPPLKERFRDRVVQVGVILRPAITEIERRDGDYLVAYLRRFAPASVLRALQECGREVRVYGLGERTAEGNLSFRAVHERHFLDDLAGSAGLVCTAGNQLVGEALYLGKPVLAFPEPANYEQYINAHFLAQEGTGEWVEMDALSGATIRHFLDRGDEYRAKIVPEKYNGTPLALRTIEDFLQQI